MTRIPSLLRFLLITTALGCTGIPEGLAPVEDFDPARYLGKWYEIARLDHSFERHLNNVSAIYTRDENGDIRVQNEGFNTKTKTWEKIGGRARFIASDDVGSLKVSFFWPFYGGYHIIALDRQKYRYAMVSGPSRSYLWILSRQKTLDQNIYDELISKAASWGFDTAELIRVAHDPPSE